MDNTSQRGSEVMITAIVGYEDEMRQAQVFVQEVFVEGLYFEVYVEDVYVWAVYVQGVYTRTHKQTHTQTHTHNTEARTLAPTSELRLRSARPFLMHVCECVRKSVCPVACVCEIWYHEQVLRASNRSLSLIS